MRRVWPGMFVEESSLMRNTSVLRKVLGDENGVCLVICPPSTEFAFDRFVALL